MCASPVTPVLLAGVEDQVALVTPLGAHIELPAASTTLPHFEAFSPWSLGPSVGDSSSGGDEKLKVRLYSLQLEAPVTLYSFLFSYFSWCPSSSSAESAPS